MTLGKKILLIFCTFCTSTSIAQSNPEICSRVALINYQEVLVDLSSSQKGEGLRYYLEKDNVSKKLLDKYQKEGQVNWKTTLLGSTGTLTVLSSLFLNTSKNTKKTLRFSGVFLLIINFLLANSYEENNEVFLREAVEEYNKRNLPKIEFPSLTKKEKCCNPNIIIGKTWSF